MHNRSEIKWKAFESLYKTNEVKKNLVEKRNYQKMPDLSLDQYMELEEQLKCAFSRGSIVLLTYYRYPRFYQIKDKIKSVDNSLKKIYLESGKTLDMRQIVKIKLVS